ncbi:GFA family protein [Paraburkholderia heleia]|uniref:GFA family protein n=1 Tax=Paraburkholderia heleia TaxID=634127 RepID=UPI000A051C92|nr:GFA family protein [Paraburkholderia heleia]
MPKHVLTGGCFCGNVRYEVAGQPFNSTICHCDDCRRAAAAPLVACFSIKRQEFRFTQGTPKSFASSTWGTRSFCPDCGTQLTFLHSELPDEIDVTTCSLDIPELVPPTDHVRTAKSLPWIHLADDLPKHSGRRDPA